MSVPERVQENVYRCLDTGSLQLGAGPEVRTPGLSWLLQEPGATDRTRALSGRQIFTAVAHDDPCVLVLCAVSGYPVADGE